MAVTLKGITEDIDAFNLKLKKDQEELELALTL